MSNEAVAKDFLHRHEAEMAKGLLDNNGIRSRIFSEGRGALGFRSAIQLIVLKSDLARAKQVLAVLEASPLFGVVKRDYEGWVESRDETFINIFKPIVELIDFEQSKKPKIILTNAEVVEVFRKVIAAKQEHLTDLINDETKSEQLEKNKEDLRLLRAYFKWLAQLEGVGSLGSGWDTSGF